MGLHNIFAALPEEEKDTLRVTCFAPLLLINPIVTMLTLAVEIFDRHLSDMKFQFGETIIQMKHIHVCLILGLRVSPIVNELLFIDPEPMMNFRMRQFPKKKNTYGLKEIDDALKQAKLERHQGNALICHLFSLLYHYPLLRCSSIKFVKNYTIFSPPKPGEKRLGERNQIEAPAIGTARAIGATLAIEPPAASAPVIGSSSSATEIGDVVVRVCSQLEEHGKILLKLDIHSKMLQNHGKMLEQISMSTVGDTPLLGQFQFSTPDKTAKRKQEGGNKKEDVKKKKAEPRTKKDKGEWQTKAEEADVPNMKKKFKGLKKEGFTDDQFGHQVAPGVGLKVVKDLMVDDDDKVRWEVNFKAISSEYGSDLLEASVDQATAISAEEQTLEVEKTKDEC
ncbi:hypothetical protein GIB67_003684 [Kingdonia uniflora]|uniref:Uncharacterized protein n=1 Tax=Kingdonia uniflora TaxID=39325 RepID=A0A7J7M3W4_9MAGN|nr:hypothetical protein GIB67_003684 [Kingdonia uniflora]